EKTSVQPLKLGIGRLLPIVPVVVGANRDHVVALPDDSREIKTECGDPVLVKTGAPAVDPDFRRLPDAFELDKDLFPLITGRDPEMFAVPRDARRKFLDVFAERVVLVPRSRERDEFPVSVVELDLLGAGGITDDQLPVGVEVVCHSRKSM